MSKVSDAQRRANARYRKKVVRFEAYVKQDSERGRLLQKAKDSGTLPEKFWDFLEKEFS